MHTKLTFLIGAGGHAKVVYDAMLCMKMSGIKVWDDDESLSGASFMDVTVQSPLKMDSLGQQGHIAIGDALARKKLFACMVKAKKQLVAVVHPLSSIANTAEVGDGSFVAAYTVLAPHASLAEGVIVNHGAVVDHDCQVGSFSHIAPNATLGGGVVIGEGCLIGSGAIVLPGVQIAAGVTVGAGAVVISDIKDEGVIVCGVPAQ